MKVVFLVWIFCCGAIFAEAQSPVDKKATQETKALYSNLSKISESNVLFGHHEDEAYGLNWIAEPGRSDVKEVCGSYPAVHGWDLGREDKPRNVDDVDFTKMHTWITDVFRRGGVNTISWHVDNPVTGGTAWDTTRLTVSKILTPGKEQQAFLRKLDLVADFLAQCKSGDTLVPVIFRPFHEHNGSWFWWGKKYCTEQQFVQLWRLTVDYLKSKRNLHHLLYAFSPDRSCIDMGNFKASYLYGYPGDQYVDVIGYDDYMDAGILWNKKTKGEQLRDLVMGLKNISDIAGSKKKIAAITETGLEAVTDKNWFTEVLLNPMKANKDIHLAYFMVWRNANEKHHYAPYPGHPAAEDFIGFYNDPLTLFEDDLQNMYTAQQPLIRE